jgi:alpha-ketoglutarate-dependent taurine dioxygenase
MFVFNLKTKKGNDILFMQNLFPNVIVSSPESLKFDKTNRRLFLNSQPEQTLDQFILELHQDEILTFDDSVLRFLVESCKLLNDLRTVFIVHDKRFLTLLCQDDLLDDYLNKSEHETIRKHRLVSLDPSRLNYDRNLRERVLKEREWWLVKPRQYGKGEGIIFGKNVSQLEWTELIAHVVNSDEFILQECLIQEKFEITRHQSQSGIDKISVVDFRLVGTLLCLNEQFLGPGIFRASSQDLITLKQGADVLFPIKERPNSKTLQTSQLPLLNIQTQYEPLEVPEQAKFILKTCSFENVGNYENALLKHGIVLIQFDSNENILSNGFFLSLIRHLGEPFTHSKMVHDFIWNIKPSQSNLNRPRSQTDEEFQMHTDASFEPIPPRYFALYVLKSDRFGGGQSLLLDLESILERLTKKEMSLLMNTAVKFEIPQEFRKDENEFTMGSILSPRRDSMNRILCRYRRDVIMNREQMSSDYKKALRKFEQIIDLERGRNRIKSLMLQKNSILIVDNSIWIHGRTKIFDPNRHLARIRFQTRNSLLLPW